MDNEQPKARWVRTIEDRSRSAAARAKCEECGRAGGGVLVRERLDERTFRPERRRLCAPCGALLGYRLALERVAL